LVQALTQNIRDATEAGDLHVARIAHEALGKLLDAVPAKKVSVAEVSELASVRRKRG
jgi:hypothetical protein